MKKTLVSLFNSDWSRGFGFVVYYDKEAAEDVISIHMHNVEGKRVECKLATPKETKAKKPKKLSYEKKPSAEKEVDSWALWKMFVGGLPKATTDDDLKTYFSQFGELDDYVVMIDRDS